MKRRSLAISVLLATGLIAPSGWPLDGHAAVLRSAHGHHTVVPFDVKLYESYVRAHHRSLIPYHDRTGKLTDFARAWMSHRKMCGGALTGQTTNPTTLSTLQEWQGCTAVRRIGQHTIKFTPSPWIK